MRWVQGHQQVMLAPGEWWQVEGLCLPTEEERCWNQGYTAGWEFHCDTGPSLPSHFSGYF